MLIYGVNPVIESLRAGRVRVLRVATPLRDRVREIRDMAVSMGIPVQPVPASELDHVARGGVHQGVAAEIDQAQEYGVTDLVTATEGTPLLVVLDGIEDPHNLGAILRTVDAVGASGVIRQTRHAARLDGAAAKASAGAVAHVKVASVVNISRAIGELKDAGVWTIGLDASARESYDEIDFTMPSALVLGAEGQGLRRLVRESCDRLASIPMRGHVESLNVSVAAAVVLFEAVRQRSAVHRHEGRKTRAPETREPED
jgi:23S rRNA (guanosine2251-2'-O)-methyltransferase